MGIGDPTPKKLSSIFDSSGSSASSSREQSPARPISPMRLSKNRKVRGNRCSRFIYMILVFVNIVAVIVLAGAIQRKLTHDMDGEECIKIYKENNTSEELERCYNLLRVTDDNGTFYIQMFEFKYNVIIAASFVVLLIVLLISVRRCI